MIINKFYIFKNKTVNYFLFRKDILSSVYKTGLKVISLEDNIIYTIKHCIIGTKNIRYSILKDNEIYCTLADHNYLKVLK